VKGFTLSTTADRPLRPGRCRPPRVQRPRGSPPHRGGGSDARRRGGRTHRSPPDGS